MSGSQKPLTFMTAAKGVRMPFLQSGIPSLLFFQTLVAGDSWGLIGVPLMDTFPGTSVVLAGSLITIQLGLLNLILSVIVEKAASAHAEDTAFRAKQRADEREEAKAALLHICSSLDEDCSGCLSLDELLLGYDGHKGFLSHMQLMDVQRDDIRTLFEVMDDDLSGNVDFTEFVNVLHRIKTVDTSHMMVFLQHSMKELNNEQRQLVEAIDGKVMSHLNNLESHAMRERSRPHEIEGIPSVRRMAMEAIETDMRKLLDGIRKDMATMLREFACGTARERPSLEHGLLKPPLSSEDYLPELPECKAAPPLRPVEDGCNTQTNDLANDYAGAHWYDKAEEGTLFSISRM